MKDKLGIIGDHDERGGLVRLQQRDGAASARLALEVDEFGYGLGIDLFQGGEHRFGKAGYPKGGAQGCGQFQEITSVQHAKAPFHIITVLSSMDGAGDTGVEGTDHPTRLDLLLGVCHLCPDQGRLQGARLALVIPGRGIPGGGDHALVFVDSIILHPNIMQQRASGGLGRPIALRGLRDGEIGHGGLGLIQPLGLGEEEIGDDHRTDRPAQMPAQDRIDVLGPKPQLPEKAVSQLFYGRVLALMFQ